MIGGGGKIGGSGGVIPPPQLEGGKQAAEGKRSTGPQTGNTGKLAADSFERGGAKTLRSGGPRPQSLGSGEISGMGDLLRMAKENPPAARRLVATMAAQTNNTLSEIDTAMAGARAVLEQLGAERYSKKAREEKGRELRKARDKLASLKRRLHLGNRKMALLQQLAGKLGDPRLDEELERLLRHHDKLQTEWGRRHHLLALGDALGGDDQDTPEHLRDVLKADIHSGAEGAAVGDTLHEISPRRVIAELIARTIDGSVRPAVAAADDDDDATTIDPTPLGQRGEFGRTFQSYVALSTVIEEALGRDPFAKDNTGGAANATGAGGPTDAGNSTRSAKSTGSAKTSSKPTGAGSAKIGSKPTSAGSARSTGKQSTVSRSVQGRGKLGGKS